MPTPQGELRKIEYSPHSRFRDEIFNPSNLVKIKKTTFKMVASREEWTYQISRRELGGLAIWVFTFGPSPLIAINILNIPKRRNLRTEGVYIWTQPNSSTTTSFSSSRVLARVLHQDPAPLL